MHVVSSSFKFKHTPNADVQTVFVECDELMVDGSSGILVAETAGVIATSGPNDYTCFDLPSNVNKLTLVSHECDCIKITKFVLWVKEICADGHPLYVEVVFKTYYGIVSDCQIHCRRESFKNTYSTCQGIYG